MIYLDHHAATPLAPSVTATMHAAEATAWANPASVHWAGRAAKRVLEAARTQVARSIGCEPNDLILTSGGSEACNLGVLGISSDSNRVVTTSIEHPAVKAAVDVRAAQGATIERLHALDGVPDSPEALRRLLGGEPCLVAVQWVNHETGTIWPIAEYANVCREVGAALVVDATQAWGKLPLDVAGLGATAVAIASHKAGGPAGAGALWVARGVEVAAQIIGGGQERGRRAGSPDPVTQAGFGAAALAVPGRLAGQASIAALRDRLEAAACDLGGVVNGGQGPRVGTVTNLSFRGRTGAALVAALDLEGVCCSSGAACSSGLNEPSPVLRAMTPGEPWRAESAVRFSLGPETTETDVEFVLAALRAVLSRPPA